MNVISLNVPSTLLTPFNEECRWTRVDRVDKYQV